MKKKWSWLDVEWWVSMVIELLSCFFLAMFFYVCGSVSACMVHIYIFSSTLLCTEGFYLVRCRMLWHIHFKCVSM